MKQGIVLGCIALLLGSLTFAGFGQADDWGTSGAKPEPVKDTNRAGYWWWPKIPPSDATEDSLWGNRGRVYEQLLVNGSVSIPNETLFGFDEATLSESGKKDMADVASYLNDHSEDTLEIQGHTCNINLSGDSQYNTRLGLRRAESVRKALVEFGVSSARLTAVSRGESDPAVPNDSPKNRALNRRVEFVLGVSG